MGQVSTGFYLLLPATISVWVLWVFIATMLSVYVGRGLEYSVVMCFCMNIIAVS